MRVIDAHHHLWDPVSGRSGVGYTWLRDIGAPKPFGDPTPIQRDYLADEYLAESAHEVVGSVHVQADGALPDPARETAWLERVAGEHGVPSAIVGFADLAAPDLDALLDRHAAASPRFRGARQIIARTEGLPAISFAPREFLDDPAWREGYALLNERNLLFDLQLHPAQMTRAAEFVGEHPGVPVAIDHAGSPHDRSERGLREWREGMGALAAVPHATCKISGLGMFDPDWTATTMAPVIDAILELFGPERTMWGSNFPVDKLFGSFDRALDSVAARVPQAMRNAVFRDTAARFYRIDAPGAAAGAAVDGAAPAV